MSCKNIRSHTWGNHNMGLVPMTDSMRSCIPLLNVVKDSKQLFFRSQVPIFSIEPSSCHVIKHTYEIPIYGSPFILVGHSFLDKNECSITTFSIWMLFPFGHLDLLHPNLPSIHHVLIESKPWSLGTPSWVGRGV